LIFFKLATKLKATKTNRKAANLWLNKNERKLLHQMGIWLYLLLLS